jgi:hypothetical protein
MNMKKIWLTTVIVLAAVAAAQDEPKTEGPTRIEKQEVVYSVSTSGAGGNMVYVSSEMSLSGKTVKGAPYSAQATTETTQTLGDGNRIHRKGTSMIYRDSEGRTRNEMSLGAVGPFGAGSDTPQIVMINDPVAGVNYILNSKDRTVHKMTVPEGMTFSTGGSGIAGSESEALSGIIEIRAGTGGGGGGGIVGGPLSTATMSKRGETQSLGKQMIGGVSADGTRTTSTIPAGEIGNEQPIQVISERWYSPELQTVVMSKNSDPRMGETVYQLSNIVRAEPMPSLFQVPADYTVTGTGKAEVHVETNAKP